MLMSRTSVGSAQHNDELFPVYGFSHKKLQRVIEHKLVIWTPKDLAYMYMRHPCYHNKLRKVKINTKTTLIYIYASNNKY